MDARIKSAHDGREIPLETLALASSALPL